MQVISRAALRKDVEAAVDPDSVDPWRMAKFTRLVVGHQLEMSSRTFQGNCSITLFEGDIRLT